MKINVRSGVSSLKSRVAILTNNKDCVAIYVGNKATYHFSENAWKCTVYIMDIFFLYKLDVLLTFLDTVSPSVSHLLYLLLWMSAGLANAFMDSQKLDANLVATAALLLLQNDLRSNLKVSLEFLKISWGACLQTPLILHAYACIRTHQTTMYLLSTGLIMHGKTRSCFVPWQARSKPPASTAHAHFELGHVTSCVFTVQL